MSRDIIRKIPHKYFLNIPDIKGESEVSGHEKGIRIHMISDSYAAFYQGDTRFDQAGKLIQPSVFSSGILVQHKYEAGTPGLIKNIINAHKEFVIFKSGTISCYAHNMQLFLKMELENFFVSSVQMRFDADIPMVDTHLEHQKITHTYLKPDGTTDSVFTYEADW